MDAGQGDRNALEMRNLLLVENDRTVLRTVARALRHEGYVTWSVTGVAAALELTRGFHYGVFDIELGDGDGVELARQMLTDGRVRHAVFFGLPGPAATARSALARGRGGQGVVVAAAIQALERMRPPRADEARADVDPWCATQARAIVGDCLRAVGDAIPPACRRCFWVSARRRVAEPWRGAA